MTTSASIVVRFGDPALAKELVRVELDAAKNGDKSGFVPGDTPYFLLHHAPTLRLADISTTAGQVVDHGLVRLARDQQLLFVEDDDRELDYIPTGPVTPTWYGRDGGRLIATGQDVGADGPWPCICRADYQVQFRRLQLLPPTLALADDQTFPVAIIITMEAA